MPKNASAKDIKSAYRKRAKKHHPDQNPNDPKAKDRFAAADRADGSVSATRNRAASIAARLTPTASHVSRGLRAPRCRRSLCGFRRQQGRRFAIEFRSGRRAVIRSSTATGDIFSQTFGDAFRGARRSARATAPQAPCCRSERDARRHHRGSGEPCRKGDGDVPTDARRRSRCRPMSRMARPSAEGARRASKVPASQGIRVVKILLAGIRATCIEGRDLHADRAVTLADAVLGAKVAVETPTADSRVRRSALVNSDKVLRLKAGGCRRKPAAMADL